MPTLPVLLLALTQVSASSEPRPWPLVSADGDALVAVPAALAALEGVQEVRFEQLPVPGFEHRTVSLDRLTAATADGLLFVDGQPQRALGAGLRGDLSLWRGAVEGEVDSDVYLAFSSQGSRGWLRAGGELWHLLATPDAERGWSAARSRWVHDRELQGPALERPGCATLVPPGGTVLDRAPAPSAGLVPFGGPPVLYQARLAIETDWYFYQLFGNVNAAEAYLLSLLGAVSDTFRSNVGTRLDLSYVGLYTTPADPWNTPEFGGGSLEQLFEFRDAWIDGWPVEADLAHLISGAGLGGGVAWVGVLGLADYAYAVSGDLGGITPFPIAQGPLNWDFMVVAHETGHNFGTLHTQDYCPPLDICYPGNQFGTCQTEVSCSQGTLMSYCHLCDGGLSNIIPEFHPTVRQVLRTAIESSALRPFEGLEATELGQGLPSAGHTPGLAASYDAATNGLTVSFSDVPHPSVGVLVVGASPALVPLFGGVLVPSPNLFTVFPTSGGSLALPPATISGQFPFGAELWLQGWFADGGGVQGFAATEGLLTELWRPVPPAGLAWVAHPSNGFEYAIGAPATWLHSRSLAEQSGGTLVTIDSDALRAWLLGNLLPAPVGEDYWIGHTDGFSEGSWYWASGAAGGYTNWSPGQPDDFNGFEDYAEWWQGAAGWNDADGFEVQRAIYQRPIGSLP
jgi:hypothetical protein